MTTVLVVDPDPRERARIVLGLRERRRLTLVSCADVQEAVIACPTPPSLVIVGLPSDRIDESPSLHGLLRRTWPQAAVVLAVEQSQRLPTLDIGNRLHLFDRPVSLQRVMLLLRRETTSSQVDLPRVRLADLVQMACLGGHTMRISCSRAGHDVGTVEVVGGRLLSARDATGRGIEALSRLVAADVAARVRELDEIPPTDITVDWQHALFEAVKLSDEAPSSASFDDLMNSIAQALLRRDYSCAADALRAAAALRPDDPRVQVNTERLRKLGYLVKKGSEEA